MRSTIDGAGRIVVPKAIRDEVGLGAGQAVDIRARGGVVEIEPAATPVRLVERDGVVVAEAERPLPELTAELVRDTLERVRR
jgi:AbrB family looped-hinge helix DNA binding protein